MYDCDGEMLICLRNVWIVQRNEDVYGARRIPHKNRIFVRHLTAAIPGDSATSYHIGTGRN